MGALFAGETSPSQFVRSSSDGLRSSVRSKSGGRRVVTAGNKLSHFVGITKLWDHLHENVLCARFLSHPPHTCPFSTTCLAKTSRPLSPGPPTPNYVQTPPPPSLHPILP